MPRRRYRRRDEELEVKPSRSLTSPQSNTQTEKQTQPAMDRAGTLIRLQRTVGNQFVQRVVDSPTAAAIQRVQLNNEDSDSLQSKFIENPAAISDTEKECREIMTTGLFALLRQQQQQEQGTEAPEDTSLKETIAQYAKYRLKDEPAAFEFKDERNRITLGDQKPLELTDKVEEQLVSSIKKAVGWHFFGLSIMEAERKVLLAIDNRKPGSHRIYWMDKVEGGFKDVTGRLDERITQTTIDHWNAQPPDNRRRTRVLIWAFISAEGTQ